VKEREARDEFFDIAQNATYVPLLMIDREEHFRPTSNA
jgi:hypothetical protein